MEFNAAQVKTEFLGHLGIFTAVIERLGIIEKVNARISVSKEKGSKVSMGVRLAAMILMLWNLSIIDSISFQSS